VRANGVAFLQTFEDFDAAIVAAAELHFAQ